MENLTQTKNKATKVENDLKHVITESPKSASTPTKTTPMTSNSSINVKSQELHKKIENLTSKIEEANRKSDILVSEVNSSIGNTNYVESTKEISEDVTEKDIYTEIDNSRNDEESDEVRQRRLKHFNSTSPVSQ